jgi:hypothetical protein
VPETYVRDEATKALDAAAARSLAEERASSEWKVDLAPYKLLEQSQQTRTSGRVDHVFVYERAEKLGEARVRMRLGVAGDELTEIAPYVYIPESFDRRFASCGARTTRLPVSRRSPQASSTGSAAACSARCGSRASTGSWSSPRSARVSSSAVWSAQ